MIRKAFDELYYLSARIMPLWWHWQWQYVANARVYFEIRHEPGKEEG